MAAPVIPPFTPVNAPGTRTLISGQPLSPHALLVRQNFTTLLQNITSKPDRGFSPQPSPQISAQNAPAAAAIVAVQTLPSPAQLNSNSSPNSKNSANKSRNKSKPGSGNTTPQSVR